MNATGATLVFSVSLAGVELAGAYGGSQVRGESSFHIGSALLALALTLPVGAFAFWFGARRVRHKWYSALISGVVAFAFALATLGALKPVVSIWLQLLAIDAVIAASCFLLGRKPLSQRSQMKRGANNAFQPTRSRCALGFPSAFGPTARLNAGVRHAPLAAHSLAMHLTIALEAAAGAFLLGVVATAPAHV